MNKLKKEDREILTRKSTFLYKSQANQQSENEFNSQQKNYYNKKREQGK